MRVLIAEYDKPVATFVQKGLEAEQYAVDIAQDGDEAQFMVTQFEYDLAVLDLTLPRVDGLGVLRWLRQQPRFGAVPVVTVSGSADEALEQKASALGAQSQLRKPVAFRELVAAIEHHLEVWLHHDKLAKAA